MQPKKLKYRKPFKIIRKSQKHIKDKLHFGTHGLIAKENGLISSEQLMAARKAIVNFIKRKGKLWIRVFPDRPITKKPAEVRMGRGKGLVDHYAAIIKKGAVIFELGGVRDDLAVEALNRAKYKLSIKLKLIKADTNNEQ